MDDAWVAVSDFLAQKFGCSACPSRFSSTSDFDSHKCPPRIRCNGYIHSKACAAAPFDTMDDFLEHFKQKHIRKTACLICCMNFDEEKLRSHPKSEHAEEVKRLAKRFMTVPEDHKKPNAPKPQSISRPPPCSGAAIPSTSSSAAPAQVPPTSTPVRPSPVPADPSPAVKPTAVTFRPPQELPSTSSKSIQSEIAKTLATPVVALGPPFHPTLSVALFAFSATPAAAAAAGTLAEKASAAVRLSCAATSSTSAAPSKIPAAPSSEATASSSADTQAPVAPSKPGPSADASVKIPPTPAATPAPSCAATASTSAPVQPSKFSSSAPRPVKPVVSAKTVARFAYVTTLVAPVAPAATATPIIPPAPPAAAAVAETSQADAKALKTVGKLIRKMVDSIVRREDDMRRNAESQAEGLKRKLEESSQAMPVKRSRVDGVTGAIPWMNTSDEAMEVSTTSVHLTPPNTISPVPIASSVSQPKQSESPHSGASLPTEEAGPSSSTASSRLDTIVNRLNHTAHPLPQPQTTFTASPFALQFFNRPQGVPQTIQPPAPIVPPSSSEKAIKEELIERTDTSKAPLVRASSSSSSGPPALSPHPPQEAPSKEGDLHIQEVVDQVARPPTPPLQEVKREPVEPEYHIIPPQPPPLPAHQQPPPGYPIVQRLPASSVIFNKPLLEQGQARRAGPSQHQVPPQRPIWNPAIQCLNRMPAQPTQTRNQAPAQTSQSRVPPQPAAQVPVTLREVKEEPTDAEVVPPNPIVAAPVQQKYPALVQQQQSGAGSAPAPATAAAMATDHQYCRPDEARAPSTNVQPTTSQGPIEKDHPFSKPAQSSAPSTSAQPLTIQVHAEAPIAEESEEVHVREGSFDSVPVTPADRLHLQPIPPYKSPADVKQEPVEAFPEAANVETPRAIERAHFAGFFSEFGELARGVQERIEAAEARERELRRLVPFADVFDSGIDNGAAAGAANRPPSQSADEEHEPVPAALLEEEADDPMLGVPSTSGISAGAGTADPFEFIDEEDQRMTEESAHDPTENAISPSSSRSVTPVRITRRRPRKRIDSSSSEGPDEKLERMDEGSVNDPIENASRPSPTRSVTPLRISRRRSPRKHTGYDDPMEGPSTSGMSNGSAANEALAEQHELMDEEHAHDSTEDHSRPSTSRSVTPLRITIRRSPRKHTGDSMLETPSTSAMHNGTAREEHEPMDEQSVNNPTENRSRPSSSRSVTPLRITRRTSPRKQIGNDDSTSERGRSIDTVTPRSCLKRRNSPRKSKAHIAFADKEAVPVDDAREGHCGQFPEEPANAPSENGSDIITTGIKTRRSLRTPKLEATVKQEHPSPRVQSPINWDEEYEINDKKDILRLRERRSRSVKAEPMEEDREKNEHEKFWSGETESNDCPECGETISQNPTHRKTHYKQTHYDIFYAGERMSVETWMCWKLGPPIARHESDKGSFVLSAHQDDRACLMCSQGSGMHRGRLALIRHMKQEHKKEFKVLKEAYRLHQRFREPPEDHRTHLALQ